MLSLWKAPRAGPNVKNIVLYDYREINRGDHKTIDHGDSIDN
jgi:hypothetical protein